MEQFVGALVATIVFLVLLRILWNMGEYKEDV